MSNYFTLHVRMTKRCNADCSYCSSYELSDGGYMSFNEFVESIDFIDRKMSELGMGGDREHLTIQYVGGEILTLPSGEFEKCVKYAREKFSKTFDVVIDGVQSNLIGSSERLLFLKKLFGSRIGTSVDNFTDQRTVAGSALKYKTIFIKRHEELEKSSLLVPAIYVVDKKGLEYANQEVLIANERGYDLTLRAVFQGGSDINAASIEEIDQLYGELFDAWILKQGISIQPFFQLLAKRLGSVNNDDTLLRYNVGCPFQNDCAKVSLNLEPGGDLYVCLDMADSGQYPLGNALSGEFDTQSWRKLLGRQYRLPKDCLVCDYFQECQGGCMSEAMATTDSPFGKTELCRVWKTLFRRIDNAIEVYGADRIKLWMDTLHDKNSNGGE